MNESKNTADFIGYLRYEGRRVEDGIIDARSAAHALRGFDSALRYFLVQERPELADTDFPIPVRIRPGSWEALIPQTVGGWIATATGIVLTGYLTSAATKLAENDFKGVKTADLFRKGLKGVQWMIKIGKHLGSFNVKRLTGVRWRNDNNEVGLPNEAGEFLYVPRHTFEQYFACPSGILSEAASVIEFERRLVIAVEENGRWEKVTIDHKEKVIFYANDIEKDALLFPELVHGQHVVLEGVVTRANERANSIGFLYKEHVLTCRPRDGSIVRFKPHLFLRCRLEGVITRANEDTDEINEPRPKIVFDDLILLEDEGTLL